MPHISFVERLSVLGDERNGIRRSYKLFGFQKDPKSTDLGEYTFKAVASSRIRNSLAEVSAYQNIQDSGVGLIGWVERINLRSHTKAVN
eukprot:scaffold1521_cov271-Chaetoceros_neogracile.AAC.58